MHPHALKSLEAVRDLQERQLRQAQVALHTNNMMVKLGETFDALRFAVTNMRLPTHEHEQPVYNEWNTGPRAYTRKRRA